MWLIQGKHYLVDSNGCRMLTCWAVGAIRRIGERCIIRVVKVNESQALAFLSIYLPLCQVFILLHTTMNQIKGEQIIDLEQPLIKVMNDDSTALDQVT